MFRKPPRSSEVWHSTVNSFLLLPESTDQTLRDQTLPSWWHETMKFRVVVSEAASATPPLTYEMEIAVSDLRKHPETMLSKWSKPQWASSESEAVHVIQPVEVTQECWTESMGRLIERWYAEAPPLVVPSGVEVSDFVAIADWLGLEVPELASLTYEDETDEDFARTLRGKAFAQCRVMILKGIANMKKRMSAAPDQSYQFLFMQRDDKLPYIQRARGETFLDVGAENRYNTSQVNEAGTREDHFRWSAYEIHRQECVRILTTYGLSASWVHLYLELAGPRDMDFPPPDMDAVHAHRWALKVSVPTVKPASKRRRVATPDAS